MVATHQTVFTRVPAEEDVEAPSRSQTRQPFVSVCAHAVALLLTSILAAGAAVLLVVQLARAQASPQAFSPPAPRVQALDAASIRPPPGPSPPPPVAAASSVMLSPPPPPPPPPPLVQRLRAVTRPPPLPLGSPPHPPFPPCADSKPPNWCEAKAPTSCGTAYVLASCRRACGACHLPPSHPPLRPPPSPPRPPKLQPAERRCRAHCPRAVRPLPLIAAAASREASSAPSIRCIDGARMSFCLPLASSKGDVWLSVRVRPDVPIDSIGIFVYRPWSSDFRLSPYEVWAGDAFGDVGSSAVQCTLPPSPAAEPTHGGTPAIVSCHGVMKPFLTLRQLGDARRWFISEIEVPCQIARAPSRAPGDSLPPLVVVRRSTLPMTRLDRQSGHGRCLERLLRRSI